jgi:hypothetical protein
MIVRPFAAVTGKFTTLETPPCGFDTWTVAVCAVAMRLAGIAA